MASSKKVLINGAGGFIGRHLVTRFLADGYAVRASDLPGVDLGWAKKAGAETDESSLEDPAGIDRSVKGCDIVVHTAAIFDLACPREKILRVNVEGTRHYSEASLKHGVERMVLFSTSGVYGVPKRLPCTEDTEKRPRNAYELSKWQSEQLAMRYHAEKGLPVTAIRPTLVYGPGSKYGQAMYLTLFLAMREWGIKSLHVPKGGKLSHHVHVDDVVSGVRTLAEADGAVGRSFNVADDCPMTAEETLSYLLNIAGIETKPAPGAIHKLLAPAMRLGPWYLNRPLAKLNQSLADLWPKVVAEHNLVPALQPRLDIGWLGYLYADHVYSTEALKSIGWKCEKPLFTDGMRETVDWYIEQRWIPEPSSLGREKNKVPSA